jgi:hypothetical protein
VSDGRTPDEMTRYWREVDAPALPGYKQPICRGGAGMKIVGVDRFDHPTVDTGLVADKPVSGSCGAGGGGSCR